MRDYCQETLAKKELIKKMNDDKLTYEMLDEAQKATYDYALPDAYYQYKLKGVVVHYGTVDGGHYYSYIKDRGTDRWYEFNDTTVRDYDPADLAEDTFGGTFKHARRSDRSGRVITESERLHNAYVLIYEREEFLDGGKIVDLTEAGERDLAELVRSCTIPLEPLRIGDDILQDLTSNYDKTWIANKMFDDSFIDTVLQMCKNSSVYLQLSADRSYDQAMDLDESADELYKLKFTTLFFLGVTLRSESRLQFAEGILMPLLKTAGASLSYSQWLVSCFSKKHTIDEFFSSNWSTEACRLVNSLFVAAFRRVHSEEVEQVVQYGQEMVKYKSGSPEDGAQFLKDSNSDPECNVPLTIRCLYNFMLVL